MTGARVSLGMPALGLLLALLGGCAAVREAMHDQEPAPNRESPADLYVNMAAAYLQRGQMEAALDRAQQALREDYRSARAHYMLAIVHQQLGETTKAETHFAKAIALDGKNPDFRNAWGAVLCKQQRFEEADKQFQAALANPLYETPEVALMNAADCARRAGNAVQAETYLREALTANPNFAPALLGMAQRGYDAGDYRAARGYMERYSRVGEVTAKALLLAARIERKLGNAAEAKALEVVLRQRFPDAPEVMQLAP